MAHPDSSSHSPIPGQQVGAIIILSNTVPTLDAEGTSMTGFLVHARDPAAILYALRDLCAGHEPVGESAQRVRLTLHKADGTVGGHGLSPREQEVLCGLSKGLSYKMIANELHISFETVRSHVKGIYLKMDVKNNTAAVAKAIHCGLVAG